jgi:ferredoxin
MRVEVDLARCQAHGECVMTAPSVFDLDEQDHLHYSSEVTEADRTAVERAARACPMQAIRIGG